MTNAETETTATQNLVRNIGTIVVLAIVLGLAIQLAMMVTGAIGADSVDNVLSETVGNVSWSVIVCFGVTAGTTIRKSTAPVAAVIAFVCAPIALGVAKGAQRGVNELSGVEPEAMTSSLLLIAAVKAVQYGFLGFMLNRLSGRGVDRLLTFMAVGAGAGVTFGLLNVLIRSMTTSLAWSDFAPIAVNELLFPLGCAIAVYVASAAAKAAT
ncbi:hypothetical protein [Smaragdicoccus niigatensis]|uniref:hypothetical protein n=1 Tax=Smaragdicoccus niigatensis TaxID=359359 RepID=UPI0003653143|nr:hypothetical protein [Smaragdicoccus niigatensis]